MNLLKKLNEYPPFIYRVLAAERGTPLGPDEIAERSGLSRSTVQRVSTRKSWAGVRIGVAEAFVRGCGFQFGEFKDISKRVKYIEANGLSSLKHLNVSKHAPLWRRGANGNTKKFLIKIISED